MRSRFVILIILSLFSSAAAADFTQSSQGNGAGPTGVTRAGAKEGEASVVACGPSCHLQKAYESAIFQLQYAQKKSELLKQAWDDSAGKEREIVKKEVQGFCTPAEFSSDRSVCYKNSQLFLAASIQRYQDAIKNIANEKAQLMSGRQTDGSIANANTAVVDHGTEAEKMTLRVPTLLEIREIIQRELVSKKGVFTVSPTDMELAWQKVVYFGPGGAKSVSFPGAGLAVKDVEDPASAGNDGTKSQVYKVDKKGNAVVDEKLSKGNAETEKIYKDRVAGKTKTWSVVEYKEMELKNSLVVTGDRTKDSIALQAFMDARNGLALAFEGGVKKVEQNRQLAVKDPKPATGIAGAKNDGKATSKKVAQAKEIEVGEKHQNAKTSPTDTYGRFGAEGQVKPNERSYQARHSGLNEELYKSALEEARGD